MRRSRKRKKKQQKTTPSGGSEPAPPEAVASQPVPPKWLLADDAAAGLRRANYILAGVVFLATLIVYIATLAPTVTAEDSGELIAAAYLGGVAHPPGYPLWCILTRPFFWIPVGDMAWRANLASAFWGSLTAAGVFLLARRWGTCRMGAWVAAAALAFSQRYWSQSVITEVYTLNCFLVVAILHCLESCRTPKGEGEPESTQVSRWRMALLALGLIYGLSLTNHYMIMMLVSPGLVVLLVPEWRRLRKEWRCLLGAVALGCVGLLVYLYLPIAASRNPFVNWGNPDTWQGMKDHILRRSYREIEFAVKVTSGTKLLFFAHFAYELWNQFSPYLLLLAPVGLCALWRADRARFWGSVGVFLLNTVVLLWILHFAFERENRQRVEVYYLPAYMITALWIGLGATRVLRAVCTWAGECGPAGEARPLKWPGRLAWAFLVLLALGPLLPFFRHLHQNNRRGFYIARDYSESICRTAEKDAVLFPSADYTTFPIIYLMGVEKDRPDFLLADKYGMLTDETHEFFQKLAPEIKKANKNLIIATIAKRSGRPVYVTDRSVFVPLPDLKLVPWGLLYRVCPARNAPASPAGIWEKIAVRNLEESAASHDSMERGLASGYYRMRAEHLLSRKRIKEGLPFLRKAADAVSDDHKGLNNLGSIAAENNQKQFAMELYRRALRAWPDYVTPHVNLAEMALAEGRLDDAQMHLHLARVINGKHPRVVKLANRMAAGARPRSKIEMLLGRVQTNPKDPVAHNDLGSALAEAGKFDDAIHHWKKALELRPAYPLPHRNLALVYEKEKKDPEKAKYHKEQYERIRKLLEKHLKEPGPPKIPVPEVPKPPEPRVPGPPGHRAPQPHVPRVPKPPGHRAPQPPHGPRVPKAPPIED